MHPLETFCGVGNRPVDGIVSPALGTKQVFIGLNNILGFPSSSTGKRTHLQRRRSWFDSCVRKFSRRRDRLPTPASLGLPDGSDSKESACNGGDLVLIPGLGRSSGEDSGRLSLSLGQPFGKDSAAGFTGNESTQVAREH